MGSQTAIRVARTDPEAGRLYKAIKAALDVRDEMRNDGASEVECAAALEEAVRKCWPFTREWKYLCAFCDDTGLKLERQKVRIYGDIFVPVGVPCSCSLGSRFVPKPKRSEDFTQAGKTPPMRPFGR